MSKTTFTGSEIILRHIQIKSTKKARKLAKALHLLEIECGIQSVNIVLEESFVCPDVKTEYLNRTPMEEIVKKLIKAYRDA